MAHLPQWMRERLPQWVLRLGIIGFFIYILLRLIELVFGAILEQEVQSWWGDRIRPIMFSSITIEIPLWVPVISAFAITTGVGVIIYLQTRQRLRWENSRLNPRRLRWPEDWAGSTEHDEYDRMAAVRAWYKVKVGRLSADDFAAIVQQSVNSKQLQPQMGATLLEEVGYVLTVCRDGSHRAEKKKDNGGQDEDRL